VAQPSWRHFGALCTLAFLQTASHAAAPAFDARTALESRIGFASHRDGNWEIYVMDADGTRQTRLTTRAEQDRFPLWSPDGSKLAFGSQVGEHGWQLWVMNADGTNPRILAANIVAKGAREWSHDGKRIVFAGEVRGDLEILSVGVDGGAPINLTNSAGDDRNPSWSPDGQHIAFSSTRTGKSDIYIMRADGSDVRRLTTDSAANESPAFAPDGSTIAFVSHRDGVGDIYIMRADGSDLRRLTVDAGATRDALRWSPDASHIAFQAAHATNYDIEIVRIADRRHTRFAATAAYDGMATWSPDGKRIAFISGRDGADAAYLADADGSNLRRLTTSATLNPAFSR
jgi:Tol biopolymer transport system component